MKKNTAAQSIQELQFFGEFGGVNPSISDSSTYTFLSAQSMADTFEGKTEGCHLYSRHSSPSGLYLSEALAKMEATESAHVFASGMGAITSVILQLCKSGDHVVSSRTVYGGTYAFMKNFAPKLTIETSFVDIVNLKAVENAIQKNTKVLYCETVSNPLMEVANIQALAKIAQKHKLTLVVDNTFTPLVLRPKELGADVIIHSLTKFINGSSDTVGGAVCASEEFINKLKDVNDGAAMLLGQTLDSLRAASVLKNLRTLPIRMKQHSTNALYLAKAFQSLGFRVIYPGLNSAKSHEIMKNQMDESIGFGGLFCVDLGSLENANLFMEMLKHKNLGYLAVSLGFYKTLFSAPGSSTSSEIPENEQEEMGLSKGLVRFSIGLDYNIHHTFEEMKSCLEALKIKPSSMSI